MSCQLREQRHLVHANQLPVLSPNAVGFANPRQYPDANENKLSQSQRAHRHYQLPQACYLKAAKTVCDLALQAAIDTHCVSILR